jgi:hypothetical protein
MDGVPLDPPEVFSLLEATKGEERKRLEGAFGPKKKEKNKIYHNQSSHA